MRGGVVVHGAVHATATLGVFPIVFAKIRLKTIKAVGYFLQKWPFLIIFQIDLQSVVRIFIYSHISSLFLFFSAYRSESVFFVR